MKTRILLLFVAAALVALGLWNISRRGTKHIHPARTQAEVPIQDGKTIDFSSGNAVVKDNAKERALITTGVAQIEAAAGNVTFNPPAAAPGRK